MRKSWAVFFIFLGVVLVVWLWFLNYGRPTAPVNTSTTTTATSTPQNSGLTLPGGQVSLSYSPDFGLAVAGQPLPVRSYIPPCDQGFEYCLYYNGNAYQGTNFESAGIRINQRADLKTQNTCLKTQPAGYTGLKSATLNGSGYWTSAFAVSGAGAGHYASGALYRLFFATSTCDEFETRIGETQFANYPSGTIQQFTDAERTDLFARLRGIIDSITLNGSAVTFPPTSTSTQP